MCPRACRKRHIMGRHHEWFIYPFSPEQRGGEMHGVKRSECRRHRLRGAIEHVGVHRNQLECIREGQNRGAPRRQICVIKRDTQPQAIERPKAFGHDNCA